jgi:hypothetical protein
LPRERYYAFQLVTCRTWSPCSKIVGYSPTQLKVSFVSFSTRRIWTVHCGLLIFKSKTHLSLCFIFLCLSHI